MAGPDALSLRQIADLIGAKLGCPPRYLVDSGSEPRNLIADIGKMRRLLAAPNVRFAEGCDDVIRDLGIKVGRGRAPADTHAERTGR